MLKANIKKIFSITLCTIIIFSEIIFAQGSALKTNEEINESVSVTNTTNLNISAKSAILMEASTGTVLYEKEADDKLSPASITKIMTLILIFENLSSGKIKLEDKVITSAYAKSMGGSQVFLEEGEEQTVETLIKCIVIASGNDASVAMAEYISGSEQIFVDKMNEKAKELGMNNTHFEDCCGLTDSDNHYTSARDVCIMSRELTVNYPEIFKYSGIWMENITHVTNKGSSEFGLANTNKLLKQYEGTTGLKTGSTKKAKYCLSATATRNGVDLIAVIMAAPDYKARFNEAKVLLNYGFSTCKIYKDENNDTLENVVIRGGTKEEVACRYKNPFSYISVENENLDNIEKKMEYNDIKAPVKENQVIGYAVYFLNEKEIGRVDIIATENIKKAGFRDYFTRLINHLWLI